MSLFDSQKGFVTLEEAFPNQAPFVLLGAHQLGSLNTEFGPNEAASIEVLDPKDLTAEPQMYRVWGPCAKQTAAIETGELPALVMYVKGKPNRIEPAGSLTPDELEAIVRKGAPEAEERPIPAEQTETVREPEPLPF